MINYLKEYKEDTPQWLLNYKKGDSILFKNIMEGRVGYYPGSYKDGNLVAVANQAQCVHSFLYVDYHLSKNDLLNSLETHGFSGYHCLDFIDWKMTDITPYGPHPFYRRVNPDYFFVDKNETPYCLTVILERDLNKSEDWGAKRIAVTFLFADAIAAFFQIFVKEYKKAPWLLLLQDHGFGGNYDSFGKGGLLDEIIQKENVRPKFVICAEYTNIWDGYKKIEGVNFTHGGMHDTKRYLFIDIKN